MRVVVTRIGPDGTMSRRMVDTAASSDVGIAESRAVIDAQLILDAAGRSVRLWPENEA